MTHPLNRWEESIYEILDHHLVNIMSHYCLNCESASLPATKWGAHRVMVAEAIYTFTFWLLALSKHITKEWCLEYEFHLHLATKQAQMLTGPIQIRLMS